MNRILPSVNGAINWNKVAECYFEFILSPYASEMVQESHNGQARNLLLNYMHSLSEKKVAQHKVLDVGCGPGNLIPHLGCKVKHLTGIDKSKNALSIATSKALKSGIQFEAIHDNILNMSNYEKYDLIVSSNSILPDIREDVVAMFAKISSLLKSDGKFIAVLPSFDTVMYLKQLREMYGGDANADEVMLIDDERLAYADDGVHLQCYHTEDSIYEETVVAGLTLIQAPQKIYYPWELCRRFGYGYYPQSNEEIWDWFIVAE